MRYLRHLIIALACTASAVGASALDLPVRTVDGHQYYVYQTRHGDSLGSIATLLGISRAQIVEHNPAAADGIKSGQLLMFPVDAFDLSDRATAATSERVVHTVRRGESIFGIAHKYGVSADRIVELNPAAANGVNPGMQLVIDPGTEPTPAEAAIAHSPAAETPAAPAASAEDPAPELPAPIATDDRRLTPADTPRELITTAAEPSIAVLLPLMLDNETPDRQAQLYTDFTKGLLMAAKSMSWSTSSEVIGIHILDTAGDPGRTAQLLQQPEVQHASVVITPASDKAILAAADAELDGMVLNLLNVRDTTYLDHPNVIQANTPATDMYRKAVDYMMEEYLDYIPVVLNPIGVTAEKAPFINYMRSRYAEAGIPVHDIAFEGTLHVSAFDSIPGDIPLVIVSTTGQLQSFNRSAHAISTLMDNRGHDIIKAFGYPDWLAFRGDARRMLHAIEATIYSRFFDDQSAARRNEFAAEYARWYGQPMMEALPNQAILGYDVGRYLIDNIRDNHSTFSPDESLYYGLQSCFSFGRPGGTADAGLANDAVFIITFDNDGNVTRHIR